MYRKLKNSKYVKKTIVYHLVNGSTVLLRIENSKNDRLARWHSVKLLQVISPLAYHFWPTVLSVEPLVQCVVCRLSVCLSVVCNVLYCGKTVRPSKKVSEGVNRKSGSKSSFLGRCHISTSGFAATATETAVFALFLPVQPSNRYWMVEIDFLAANHVRIVGLCGQNWNRTLRYSFALKAYVPKCC